MTVQGYLDKMGTVLDDVVSYTFRLDEITIPMNQQLGRRLKLKYLGKIRCVGCGAVLTKAYGQGFCFKCLQISPLASECIINPEKCKAHLGVSRDMAWSQQHCLTPHVVYLAYSSHIKVGVTRLTQIPTRWIDQGAIQAIPIAQLPNRHMAGMVEVFLKKFYSDKTVWQQMLLGQKVPENIDLTTEMQNALSCLPIELQQYACSTPSLTVIRYPMIQFPHQLTSVGFDKQSTIEGVLTAIKGQYLIFDNALALNVRKHTGYWVEMTLD